ncbi:rifin PIR protein,putative [Plasmodium sp. DRC-Itaito]|nr:rifin PIR protein,putative [Plasmodium sp. DRC-Itaito]
MKLHCSNILLLFLPLNILVTSYHVNTNRKTYITPHHTRISTSRVLSEGDTQSSNYDNNPQMKSVMQQFVARTSQRFEEYKERLKDKRQKRKEQRDKNVQDIIEKDKREKSLEQKIEKVCLKCGCALGGVAASVGIFGTVTVNELTKAAITAAEITAKGAAEKIGAAKGAAAFKSEVIAGLEEIGVSIQGVPQLETLFNVNIYPNASSIARTISIEYKADSCIFGGPGAREPFCSWVNEIFGAAKKIPGNQVSANKVVETHVSELVTNALTHAGEAADTATKEYIKDSTLAAQSTYASSQTAIIASVVAIVIIALVMIIIYLVLRYRQKKKMKKKAQYTKLLNQ